MCYVLIVASLCVVFRSLCVADCVLFAWCLLWVYVVCRLMLGNWCFWCWDCVVCCCCGLRSFLFVAWYSVFGDVFVVRCVVCVVRCLLFVDC